jgi:hypothetical protein
MYPKVAELEAGETRRTMLFVGGDRGEGELLWSEVLEELHELLQ